MNVDYSCFLTCVREITKDLGKEILEDEIIKAFPENCAAGTSEEGKFDGSIEEINSICNYFGFSAREPLHLEEDSKSNVIICFDNFRNKGIRHSVRLLFVYKDNLRLRIMNYSRQEEMDLTDKYLLLSPCSAILAANESIGTVEKHFGGKVTVLNQFSDSFKTSKGEDYENEIRDILSESPPTVVSID